MSVYSELRSIIGTGSVGNFYRNLGGGSGGSYSGRVKIMHSDLTSDVELCLHSVFGPHYTDVDLDNVENSDKLRLGAMFLNRKISPIPRYFHMTR